MTPRLREGITRRPAPLPLLFAACALALAASSGAPARTLIQNKGSDSLAVAVQAWADAYRWVEPDVGVAVNAGGSGTGIAALLNGTADIANSSRPMRASERARADALGLSVVEHVVGHDAVGVYVHSENPVRSLTFAQLADVFGRGGRAESWTDLDVMVPGCQDQRIVRVGRQNSSGTYAYFRTAALADDKYRQGTLAVRGTRQVVDVVADTPCAIGYGSIAYLTPAVRPVCVGRGDGACASPDAEAFRAGDYPLVRPLFIYTAADLSAPIDAYVDWILSDAGQCVLAERGYVPLRALDCAQ